MAGWNYRWFKGVSRGSPAFFCYEVYYDDKDRPSGSSAAHITGPYESIEDARSDLQLMLKGLDKPMLCDTYDTLGYYEEVKDEE